MLRTRDSGQAFPVYITVIAGLLFLAFVYFAVAQAGVTRNGGQSAADAAALAAAQDAREQLRDGWLDVILDPAEWDAFLDGDGYLTDPACRQAELFAARNDAEIPAGGCVALRAGEKGFRVQIRTLNEVGVPGMEKQHAIATATAVLEPRCSFDAPDPTPPPTTPPPTPTDSATPEPTPTPSPEPEPITGLVCDGVEWTIDPEDPQLPDVTDLFSVRLVD
ncbi:pilus assembly protein TadG-related protein [Streptomyces sp. NPDC056069]|uniref:pilus assembly protein TadG-related protein n=1 Tax=Streptomyces sp. NPDC056069 TaxID=3345702 RepID=UPI0035DEDDB7